MIPVGKNGDCYDRYLVRIGWNARVTKHYCSNVLDNIPSGTS